MKRVVLVGGIVALTVAGIGGPSRAANEPPVVIGLEVPLSPPGDVQSGQLIRRGGELAVEYINTKMGGVLGGRKVELAVEDSTGQPEAGIAGYRRLVTEKHAVAVTGFFHSSVNLAVNEVAKEMGVPTIATQTSAADITAKGYANAYRTHAIDPIRVATYIDFINKNRFKKIAVIAETTDYGIGQVEELERQIKERRLGFTMQSFTFDHGTTDLTAQLIQVKATNPDLVINIGVGQPLDLMLDQATTIGLVPKTPMLISYDAPTRPQFWQLHAKNGNGVYFIAYYSPNVKLSPLGTWLSTRYQELYKEAPVYSTLNGFGDVMIIAQAVNRAKSADPKDVVKALDSGSFQSWPTGNVTFPAAKGVYWHTWSPPLLILQYTAPNQSWRDARVVLVHEAKT